MICLIKTLASLITYVQVTNVVVGNDVVKIKTFPLKTQYPESATLGMLKRFSSKENEKLSEIPGSGIKKLLYIKALPFININLTKENCYTTSSYPDNIKVYHKERNVDGMFVTYEHFYNTLNVYDVGENNYNQHEKTNKENKESITKNDSHDKIKLSDCFHNKAFLWRKRKELVVGKRKAREIKFRDLGMVSGRKELVFPDVPTEDNSERVPDLKVEEGLLLFGLFSKLIAFMQPSSFPIDLIKDALENRNPHYILMLKLLKYEGPIIAWILVWFVLALAIPCGIIAQVSCSTKFNDMERLFNENSSNSSEELSRKWIKIPAGILMHGLLLLLLGCIGLMFVTNEKISKSTSGLAHITDGILHNVENFVTNTQTEFSLITTSSMRIALDAVNYNLKEAEELLGKPLKSALDAETGLETAMQSLLDLTKASADLSSRVSGLIKDCDVARKVEKRLHGSLIELSELLTVARQHCLPRDQAICDTLQTSGINISLGVDQLSCDRNFQQILVIGKNDSFMRSVQQARLIFQGLPRLVSLETSVARAGLRSTLNRRRNEFYDAVRSLEDLSRSITDKLTSTRSVAIKEINGLVAKDLWRWLLLLGLTAFVFVIWCVLICGAPCGCGSTPRTIFFLQSGLGLICITSVILWTFGTALLLIGVHGEKLICEPLFEEPKYTVLDDLPLSSKNMYTKNELFSYSSNENLGFSVDSALRNCEKNKPTYTSLNLEAMINITQLTNHNEWEDFVTLLERFSFNLENFKILSPTLENHLEVISRSEVNLTMYSLNISGPITSKDLNSFAEQLESVAKQLSVLESAQEMETLADKTREIINNEMQPLKQLRDKIIYKIATVEVFIGPITKKANDSLSHMKSVQTFVKSNKGIEVIKQVCRNYIKGLEKYLSQMHEYIMKRITSDVGKCSPLWNSFDAGRRLFCQMTIDPMNGFAFACFFCILLFLALTPVIIRIVASCRETTANPFSSVTHRRARNGFLIDEESTWATPSPL